MGGDGGSIPTRGDLVKHKSKSEVLDPEVLQRIRWTSCALSKMALQAPIVADDLGNLFNKEALVRALIDKQIPDEFRHIRSLKDVFSVQFFASDKAKSNDNADSDASQWMCPISLVEVGHLPFCAMRPCGCVISLRAIRQVALADGKSTSTATTSTSTTTTANSSSSETTSSHALLDDVLRSVRRCPQCAKEIGDASRDVVQLNVSRDAYELARSQLLAKIDAEKARKGAKRKQSESESASSASGVSTTGATTSVTASANVDASSDASKKARNLSSQLAALAEAKVADAEKQSSVFKSLFNKNAPPSQETFACRSISGRYF